MSCKYRNVCPSYSGWCEGPKQDFSRCVPFLLTAYENEKRKSSQKTIAKQLANDILDFVNSFGFDSETFAETICRGHKTLQQSTMRLFIATIREMAKVQPDDRNAATVELAQIISDIADDHPLPLI